MKSIISTFRAVPKKLKNWAAEKTAESFQFLDTEFIYFDLLNYDDGKKSYYIKLHHIISDDGTFLLLFRDIKNTYLRLQEGKEPDFSTINSYLDFLSYEKEYLNSDRFNEDKKFWEEQMLPMPEEISLSGIRVKEDSLDAGQATLAFASGLRTEMHAWAKENKTSIFKIVYNAIAVYISRITGTDDFVLPTFNHNRSIKEQYEMAGMFISTIPVRIQLDGEDSFSSLVKRNGEYLNYLIKERQKYPFDELGPLLREKSGIDPSFFMNVSVIGHQDVILEDMSVEHLQPPYEAGGLSIHVNPENKDITGILELEFDYKKNLYSHEDIKTIFNGLCNIIAAGIRRA